MEHENIFLNIKFDKYVNGNFTNFCDNRNERSIPDWGLSLQHPVL